MGGGTQLGGMFGGAPMGWGGKAPANATPGIVGASGRLEAFNPATMADTTEAGPAAQTPLTAAGMSSNGIPTYVSNWLSAGGQGALAPPTITQSGGLATSKPGALTKVARPGAIDEGPMPVKPSPGPAGKTVTGGASAAAPYAAGNSPYVAGGGYTPNPNMPAVVGLTPQQLAKIPLPVVKQMLAGNVSAAPLDVQQAISGKWTNGVPQDFYNYGQWLLGTAGMSGNYGQPYPTDQLYGKSDPSSGYGGSNR